MTTHAMTRFALARLGLSRLLLGAALLVLLLFWPAGSWAFWEAWLCLTLMLMPMLIFGGYMLVKMPEALERRLRTRETEPTQSLLVRLSGLPFVAMFVVAGWDFRWGWSAVPVGLV